MTKTAQEILKQIQEEGTATQVYSGRDNCCRCGCKGKYHERGEKTFIAVLNRALRKAQEEDTQIEVWELPGAINISYGEDRAYTIYYNK